jgi:MFS family permease
VDEGVSLRRNRDFALLSTGRAASSLGSNISGTAYPLLVLAMTGSAADAGIVAFFAWLPYPIFALPAGWLIDRVDRRRLMLAAEAGRLVAVGSIVVAVSLDALALAQIMIVAFVEGALFAVFSLAETPAVRHIVRPEQLGTAIAINEGRSRATSMAGRPVGGGLFDAGRGAPFVADVAASAISFVMLLLIRTPLQSARASVRRNLFSEVAEGAVWLWRQPFLRMIPALSFGINFLFQGLVLIVIVAAIAAGASGSTVGVVLGLGGLGGILGAVVAPRVQRHVPAKFVVVGAIWFWAIVLPAFAFAANPYVLGGLFATMAFAGPVWNVASSAYAVTVTPDELLGRMQGVAWVVGLGGIPLGGLVVGFLLESIGTDRTALSLAGVMVVLAVLATASRGIRHAPRWAQPT